MGVMKFSNRERGASVLEFAIVLPILLVLLFGVIEFGFIFYNKAMLTNAAREGARAGILARSPRLTEDEIKEVVEHYCENKLISFDNSVDLDVDAPPPPSPVFGDDLTVNVTYPYTFLFIPSFIPLVPQPINLTARVIMKYE